MGCFFFCKWENIRIKNILLPVDDDKTNLIPILVYDKSDGYKLERRYFIGSPLYRFGLWINSFRPSCTWHPVWGQVFFHIL